MAFFVHFWGKSQQIFLLAHRSHSGVTLVPNLFGKPTILVVGGGSLNGALDEVVSGTPYIESAQVSLSLYDSHVLLVFAILFCVIEKIGVIVFETFSYYS